jgi:SSS family solute:Na+ symporter
VIIIVVSLLTPKPNEEQIRGLTYATVSAADRQATRDSWRWWDLAHCFVVLGLIGVIYLYFRG